MANLPRFVNVGPYMYKIVEDEEKLKETLSTMNEEVGVELLGICDARNLTIYLVPNLPLPRQQEVLWHEVSHAIQDLSGLQACSMMSGEDAVGSLSALQLMVLHDNPDFAVFLLKRHDDAGWQGTEK